MIASPSDVNAERNVVREVLSEWNVVNADAKKVVLLPVGWETHAASEMGDRAQSIINKQVLAGCDVLIGVFWTRIGTATEHHPSGTVEEIEEHIRLKKPVMLYFSAAPVHPDSVDAEQYGKLTDFRESCKARGLFETYTDLADFRAKLYRHLQLKINNDDFFRVNSAVASAAEGIQEAQFARIPTLSKEAQTLLKQAAADPSGSILRVRHLGGLTIQVSGQDLVGGGDARRSAIWDGALRELESLRLIEATGPKREIFRLTREGYELADKVNP
jgi:hypothetical protein